MPKKAKAVKVVSKKKEVKKVTSHKLQAVKKPFSKSQLFQYIAENTELTKKKVAELFDVVENVVHAHLCKNSAGMFSLSGIAKFKTKYLPAQKAKKGKNPFTGEEIMVKAKPARTVVKIKPLKKLKDKIA